MEPLADGVDRHLAARYFEVWVLRLSGIFPTPRECPLCGEPIAHRAFLLESEGALVCERCGAGHRGLRISGEELEFLRRSGRQSLPRMAADRPNAALLGRVENLCGRVRRHFLQSELRSYRVMRETLGGLAPERTETNG